MMILALALAAAQAMPAQAVPTPRPVPAPPSTAAVMTPEQGDTRCFAAFALLTKEGGERAQTGDIGVLFFYGKLIGEDPGIDLAAALRTGAGSIADRLDAELIRCGAELTAASQAMQRAGEANGASPAPAPPPQPVPANPR